MDTFPQLQTPKRICVDGVSYDRYPIKTRMIAFSEDLFAVLRENVVPHYQPGDWVGISEKVISVCQNRVRHISTVKVSRLARLVQKGVKKHKNMEGWSRPEKLQVAIETAGVPRVILGMIFGALGKLVGIRGIFWRILGNRASEIDGFTTDAMYPYNEYAILPPPNLPELMQKIEDQLGIPAVVCDANFIDVQVLGVSRGVGFDKKMVRKILLDNPLGQGRTMTPFVLVRKV